MENMRRLNSNDAKRLCRICKSNGFFASPVMYDDDETCEVVIKFVDNSSDNETYASMIKAIQENVDDFNGWKSKGRIYIPKTTLNERLEENNIDPFLFLRWADRKDLIAKRGKKNRTTSARHGDQIVRCAVFYDFDSEEEC